MACSQDGSVYACGSSSGVVNIYDSKAAAGGESRPSPLKTLMNITTPLDTLRFNHDGQIMGMASSRGKDCLRLVHVPSRTVFANWPTAKTPLHNVSTIDFSPKSRFCAIGNAKGKVLLYRLDHYA
mmetsp:Transcript_26560/g.37069  ORF Transcript_26560/g.37069 Transcript_26560/m.37069 type:complete len:125 (+) Transcript_26560:168-542(+)